MSFDPITLAMLKKQNIKTYNSLNDVPADLPEGTTVLLPSDGSGSGGGGVSIPVVTLTVNGDYHLFDETDSEALHTAFDTALANNSTVKVNLINKYGTKIISCVQPIAEESSGVIDRKMLILPYSYGVHFIDWQGEGAWVYTRERYAPDLY